MPCYAIDGIKPVVDPEAYVHPLASVIGDVIIGPGCYIAPTASLRGDFGRIVLHAGCNVQDSCVLHGFPDTDTTIETDGHIGHGAIVHGATVGRNALVGMNAVLMDGVVIGEASIVASMAFVKAGFEVPARHLVAGIPAKVVRELRDDEISWKTAGTRDYQRLAQRSAAGMVECVPLAEMEAERPRIDVSSLPPKYRANPGSGSV